MTRMSAQKESCLVYFNELINDNCYEDGARVLAENVVFNYPLGVLQGRTAVVAYLREFKSAFPDGHFEVHELTEESDRVVARWTMIGTQSGEFKGRPGTGRRAELPGITQFRLGSGRIDEMWVAFNPNLLLS